MWRQSGIGFSLSDPCVARSSCCLLSGLQPDSQTRGVLLQIHFPVSGFGSAKIIKIAQDFPKFYWQKFTATFYGPLCIAGTLSEGTGPFMARCYRLRVTQQNREFFYIPYNARAHWGRSSWNFATMISVKKLELCWKSFLCLAAVNDTEHEQIATARTSLCCGVTR